MHNNTNIEITQHGEDTFKRFLDIAVVIPAMLTLFIPMVLVSVAIKATSKGTVLYFSKRVGKNNKIFLMPKFRTMVMETPDIATDLLVDPNMYLTPIGKFLRRTSIDELPQLWSILTGDMSLVGPRPALYNQADLISKRTEKGIHLLMPGLTGLAQVNGRDENSVDEKVKFDEVYRKKRCLSLDIQILLQTFKSVTKKSGVAH